MIDYESKSDLEINKAVANAKGFSLIMELSPSSSSVYCGYDGLESTQDERDYCNNWADMGPIIVSNNISVINIKHTTQWFACTDVEFENICMSPDGNDSGISSMCAKNEYYCTKPLRAAAIVFLKMMDAQK